MGCDELVKCVRCVCVLLGMRGWRGGKWMRELGLGLGFTIPVRTWGMLEVCLCLGYGGMVGVCGEWVVGLEQGLEGWGGVMSV